MPDQETLERAREDAAEGKSPSTPGRRIRAGRNRARARGHTWREVDQAGDRDRFVQGSARRGQAAAAGTLEDVRANSPKGSTGF